MMTINLGKPSNNEEESAQENLDTELWRIWMSELKPFFTAEEKFLQKYGRKVGYREEYIEQIGRDHRRMEELVWKGGEDNLREFSIILANYMRFKQETFFSQLEKILGIEIDLGKTDSENDPQPEPSA